MSKELEAFDRVWEDCSKLDLDYVSKHNLMDDLREIKKALTPPTSEEVCKALSEIEGVCVRYEPSLQAFINEHEHTLVVMMDRGLLLRLYDTYPPHLITLIGRFYEAQQ